VPVVKGEDLAARGRREPADDAVGRGGGAVEGAARPRDHAVAGVPHGAGEVPGLEAHGRPEEGGTLADGFLDEIVGAPQVSLPGGPPVKAARVRM